MRCSRGSHWHRERRTGRGKAELDALVVAVGVVPTDVVVTVVAPVPPAPEGGEGVAALAADVVGVAALLTGVVFVEIRR